MTEEMYASLHSLRAYFGLRRLLAVKDADMDDRLASLQTTRHLPAMTKSVTAQIDYRTVPMHTEESKSSDL